MISKYSVKRPYTVLVAVVLVIVLGVVSLMKMTTDLLPDMSFQYALIITTDVGASPEQVESDVTSPIEAAMATTSNIKNISSTSYNSYSIVTCEYEQSANMDSVVIEIQQKLDQLKGSWDDSVGTPTIMQISPDMLPVMIAAVDVDDMTQSELADYIDNELTPSLESIEGVASVTATGAIEESVEITLNQEKIDALNKKLSDSIESKFADAESELDSAQKKIDDGKKALEDGQSQMTDKMGSASNEIDNNRITLANTKTQLTEQLTELQKTKASLESGIAGLQTAYAGGTQLKTAIDGIDAVLTLINDADTISASGDGTTALEKQYAVMGVMNTMNVSSDAATTYVNTLPKTSTEAASRGAADTSLNVHDIALATVITARNAAIDQINSTMGLSLGYADATELSNTVSALNSTKADLNTKLAAINTSLASQSDTFTSLGVTVNSYADLPTAISAMNSSLTQVNSGISALQDGIAQVVAGQKALDEGAATMTESQISGLLSMANGYSDLTNAAAQITSGKETLDSTKESALEQADLDNILTTEMIGQLLVAQNFDMPAGYAYDGSDSYLVRVGDKVSSLEDLEGLVLMDFGTDEVGIIRLSDVADIEVTDNSADSYAIVNGNPGVMLSLEKQTGYSTGDVSDRILDKFESLEKENSALHLSVLMDQGVYIDMAVKSVVQNMIIGAILAIFVLFLFLRDVKPTLVIACSIPLSVITAVVLMYFTGITMNMISMSGLVLGIGMLVDNSIVVIENIYRLRGQGYSIKKAAVEGASQVTGAIVASTLTTVSVYAPIIFTEGITRQLFVDLALTIAYTLGASLLIAMTFVPAMSSAVMKNAKPVKETTFDRFKEWYGRFLEKCLHHKAIVFILAILLLVGSVAASLSKGFTFMDMDMETNQLTVTIEAKKGESLTFEELTDVSNQVIDRISDIEGIDTIGAMAGGTTTSLLSGSSDSVSMYVLLDEDSKVKLADVQEEIISRTEDLDCAVSTDTSAMDMSAMFGTGISVEIKGSDLDVLQELAQQVSDIVESTDGCIDVENGLDDVSPQYTISVDKEKAAEYGYTVAQVFQLVYAEMASSSSATTLSTDIKDYKVYVQTEEQANTQLSDIENLTFTYTNDDGEEEEIPLTDICTMEKTTTLSTILHDGQSRYITVSAGVDDDHNVTKVSNVLQKKLNTIDLPEGYSISMEGEDETIMDAMKQMVLMLVLAVIFIYLIMVAQFQSLLSPFIIMFSIPLGFTGGFLALFLAGQEVSIIAMLGFIMLAGLIVNNGIVLIDYINQARREGQSKRDAIIDSGKIRMRPILMTAMTTILAMIPQALGIGDGSDMMTPMAISIIGGLVYGTILTLVVIPCLYDAFNKEKDMREEEL